MKILITSTSFQDTPGKHIDFLNSLNYNVDKMRGPFKASALLPLIGQYDGLICGDDEINEEVIKKGFNGKLKIISKYGVGLDKIDLVASKKYNIPVTNCVGVNQNSVAEHTFSLLLSFYKNICKEHEFTKNGKWSRLIGHDLYGKKIGIVGLGNIGKEVAIRAASFGLVINAYDKIFDDDFDGKYKINKYSSVKEVIKDSEIISLHLPLTPETKNIISQEVIKEDFNRGSLLINTARADLVDLNAILYGLEDKILSGYLTDVLEEEPMISNHPLLKYDNVIITPHIGSRTYENVERQGMMAVNNLLKYL